VYHNDNLISTVYKKFIYCFRAYCFHHFCLFNEGFVCSQVAYKNLEPLNQRSRNKILKPQFETDFCPFKEGIPWHKIRKMGKKLQSQPAITVVVS